MSGTGYLKLFSTPEIRRWQKYLVTLSEICKKSKWEKVYLPALELQLKMMDSDLLQELLLKIGLSPTASIIDVTTDIKSAIELYCYWRFVGYYRNSVARYMKLENLTGKKLKLAAFVKILSLSEDELNGIMLHAIWKQAAIYEKIYSYESLDISSFQDFDKKVKHLGSVLSRWSFASREGVDRPYHFKLKGNYGEYHLYWILRQKSYKDEPSWPLNKRLRKFATKMIVIDPTRKQIRLIVHNRNESRLMISFLQKHLQLLLSAQVSDEKVNKDDLNAFLTDESLTSSFPIVEVSFVKSNLAGQPRITIRDSSTKDSVAGAIEMLRSSDLISVNDIAKIDSFSVLFNGRPTRIKVVGTKSGHFKLLIPERSMDLPLEDGVLNNFEKKTGLPINRFFTFEGNPVNLHEVINSILNRKTVSPYEEPPVFRYVLEELYGIGLLQKPEKENRRYCVNQNCNRKFKNTWAKGTCGGCGERLRISGVYFTIKEHKSNVGKFIYSQLRLNGFDAVNGQRWINKHRTNVFETYTTRGSVLVIPNYSSKISPSLLSYLEYNDAAVIFVPYPSTSETQLIREKGHGVVTITDLATNQLSGANFGTFSSEIERCLDSLIQRVQANGRAALKRITEEQEYDFRMFEQDIFSLLHVILPSAQRLGDQFIGKKVSDGIAAIPLREGKRFCVTWDCKHSSTIYRLTEEPGKTIRYLKKLPELPVVRNLGGLRSFVFISNNMDVNSFRNFTRKIFKRYPWEGKIVLLPSNLLIALYSHFLSFRQTLLMSPSANEKYYTNIARLFTKGRRKSYKISFEDVKSVTEDSYESLDFGIKRTDV